MTVVSIISLIPNLSSDDVIKHESLVYRSYIALGSHELVISEIDSSALTTLQAVKLHAVYFSGDKKGKLKHVHVVDVPGYSCLRPLLDEYLLQAACLVFVVDALDFLPSCRAASE